MFWPLLAKKTSALFFYTPEGEMLVLGFVMFPCVHLVSLFSASLLQAKVTHILQYS